MTRPTATGPGANLVPGSFLTALLVLAILLTDPGPAEAVDPPETAIVSMTIAGGEVGSPTDTVTVARRGTDRTLALSHKGFDKPVERETLTLSEKEFDAIWAIVIEQKLLEFTPKTEPGEAYDYGTEILRTETRTRDTDPLRTRQQSWAKPLINGDRINPLRLALARLARDRGKTVKLQNFVP